MWVYKITNTINGRIYVGKTEDSIERRWKRHLLDAKKSTKPLYTSMRAHGVENFVIEILETCTSSVELTEREMFWIHELKSEHSFGNYNMTTGGEGGDVLKHNPNRREIYKRQAQARTGKKRTPEQRANMSIAAKIRQQSYTESEKLARAEKIRASHLASGYRPPTSAFVKKGEVGRRLGIPHTAETKLKMGKARMGMTYEQLFGPDKAMVEREKRRQQLSGENNPNYVEFPPETKLAILQHIRQTKISMKLVTVKFSVSMWILRKWVRECGFLDFRAFSKAVNKGEYNGINQN